MKGIVFGLLFLLSVLLLTSCAARIYSRGNHSDLFRNGVTREAIVKALGPPDHSGRVESGMFSEYDEYLLKGPIHDQHQMQAVGMGSAMTFGLGGVVATPEAIGWSMDRSVKKVRVFYRNDTFGRIEVADAPDSSEFSHD